VQLFVDRARAVQSGFTLTADNARSVAAICRALDGLPLAIELGAARVTLFPPAALRQRLARRLPLLTDGPHDLPDRQRSLRDTIDWSYDLLAPSEQRLFRTLAVFVGGWTIEGAQAMADAPDDAAVLSGLASLVDKNLVRSEPHGDAARFRMLETLREYALDQLVACGEEEAARDRHARFFVESVSRAKALWPTAGPPAQTLDWIEADHANIRAALERLINAGAAQEALQLALGTGDFWFIRGYLGEGLAWLRRALSLPAVVDPRTRARALWRVASLAQRAGDASALAVGEASVALWQELDEDSADHAVASLQLGHLIDLQGDHHRAEVLYGNVVEQFRALGDRAMMTIAMAYRAIAAREQGAVDRAEGYAEEALGLQREGRHPWSLALALMIRADLERDRGDHAGAIAAYRRTIAEAESYGDQARISDALIGLGLVAIDRGQPERATNLFGAASAIRDTTDPPCPRWIQSDYSRALDAARSDLGDEAFQDAWDVGRALAVEQVLADQ
jgi:non-specific serine/threonine protein kinase